MFGINFASAGPTYGYETRHEVPGRPFPTELLLEVKRIETITPKKAAFKNESFTIPDYRRRLDCVDKHGKKKLSIAMTEKDFAALGAVAPGDTLAAFGLVPEKEIIFRLTKYTGAANDAAIEAWFKKLE